MSGEQFRREDALFGQLRAEREVAWLPKAFVAPREVAALGGMRSVAIIGAGGSGKSALRQWLEAEVNPPGQPPRILVATWRPTFPHTPLAGSRAANAWVAQALDVCMAALLDYLAHYPQTLRSNANWVTATVQWLIHQHLSDMAGNRELLLDRLSEGADPAGAALLRELLIGEPPTVFRPDTPAPRLIAALTDVVRRLKLAGIWVMVDGLEHLVDEDAVLAETMVSALLATLGVFEEQQFAVKLFAPHELAHPITTSSAVSRRRIDRYWLRWSVPELMALLERRIALLLDRPTFTMAALYAPHEVAATFACYGGLLPREWLLLARAFVRAYLDQGAQHCLTTEQWVQIWRTNPPPLRVDLQDHRAFIGQGEIKQIPGTAQRLLEYLYRHRDQLCTRSELYFCGMLGLDAVPRVKGDPGYAAPDEWENLINTSLWRLRNLVERDPSMPIYIVTRRGKGITLEHTI
ncbi:MAG: winged helix-turn-helix domain-containing protein [Chloroflexales bacterium]